MESSAFWDQNNTVYHVKSERASTEDEKTSNPYSFKEEEGVFSYCEGNLNFATATVNDNDEFGYNRKKITRDPMSHRIIEKRRRDRMNNCLADLSRLIPADYLKKGRGRIEKTEIIEMAIKHMKTLQSRSSHKSHETDRRAEEERLRESPAQSTNPAARSSSGSNSSTIIPEHFKLGYQECLSEAMHFLVEVEGFFANDPFCIQFITHLQKHCDKILKGNRMNQPHSHLNDTSSSSSSVGGGGSSADGKPLDLGSNSSTDGSSQPTGTTTACGDQGYDSANSSQLRDILTSPHFFNHSHRSNTVRQSPLSPLTHSSVPDGYSSSSAGSLYKFKNNIKQRFSAEHPSSSDAQSTASSSSGHKRRRDSSHEGKGTELPTEAPKYQALTTYPSTCTGPVNNNYNIPIFALHSKGAFYVPLTLDFNTLSPFLSEQNIDMTNVNFSSLILHPVTISVNFCQPASAVISRPLRLYASSPSFVSTSCSPQMNQNWPQTNVTNRGFQVLPKWATCTPETE